MRLALREALVCPADHRELAWELTREEPMGDLIDGAAECRSCGRRYPVVEGIGVFLLDDSLDTWRDAAAGLDAALSEDSILSERLLDGSLEALNGADLAFRGMILEARGDLDRAAEAFAASDTKLYPAEQRACRDRLLAHAVSRTVAAPSSIADVVDIASGRGTLVELLARAGRRVIATDISPVAMRRLRARMSRLGLGRLVDCLASDAAALPFADGIVPSASTFVGLQNIPDPQPVLREIRRVSAGPLLSIGPSYPLDDKTNRAALGRLGYAAVADLDNLDRAAATAGMRVRVVETCHAPAEPTPRGQVIEGGVVDQLPVAPTTLLWYLVEVTRST